MHDTRNTVIYVHGCPRVTKDEKYLGRALAFPAAIWILSVVAQATSSALGLVAAIVGWILLSGWTSRRVCEFRHALRGMPSLRFGLGWAISAFIMIAGVVTLAKQDSGEVAFRDDLLKTAAWSILIGLFAFAHAWWHDRRTAQAA